MTKRAIKPDRFIGLLYFLPRSCGFDLCDGDAVSVGRWIEGEGIVAEGGRQVPGEDLAVLRLCVIGEGADDELAGQGKLSELDPYLPVDTFLTEGILLAGDTVDGAGADVVCGLDLLDVGIVGAPFEEVDQRKFDAVLIVEIVGQFGEGWRGGNGGVVVDDLSEDGEVLSVEEKEPCPSSSVTSTLMRLGRAATRSTLELNWMVCPSSRTLSVVMSALT